MPPMIWPFSPVEMEEQVDTFLSGMRDLAAVVPSGQAGKRDGGDVVVREKGEPALPMGTIQKRDRLLYRRIMRAGMAMAGMVAISTDGSKP